ncbi:2'-5'-oligoadenylate synthase 3 [Notamacropus eugenii]|uniref:2'-5'-oligoadenylate synthase 3 n=1 Tax=Notamacropus eugenii TaxID=9315 RepID=UPI003B67ED66
MDTMTLWKTQPRDLDRYIEVNLLPDTTFRTEVRSAIDTISSFLKDRCFRDTWKSVRVTKVVKGGSSGKGTALRGCSDADLVVFLSDLKSYRDQINRRGEFIWEIKKRLEECERDQNRMFTVKFEVSRWDNPRVLSFRMRSKMIREWVDFDVLPAFDVLGQVHKGFRPDPQVYINLIKESWTGGEFSTCFTELQKFFLKQRCTKLKSLIRLVKHWYRMVERETFPPQYALELLTVYAWEHGSQETDFNTAQGFRTVLYLIEHYQKLKVYWTINYDFQDVTIGEYLKSQLKKPRPVILDPADPTGDVGGGSRWRWDKLAEEARRWSSAPCFKNWYGSWVKPWNVPVEQTLKGSKGYPPSGYSEGDFSICDCFCCCLCCVLLWFWCSFFLLIASNIKKWSGDTHYSWSVIDAILRTGFGAAAALPSLTLSMQTLWNTQPRALDRYIEVNLLPDTTFRTEVRSAIDTISSFLKERCFQDTWKSVRVTKVVKGGSSGKGTALRGCSDADLVVFLSDLKSYRDQINRRREFIDEIKKRLEECERDQNRMFTVEFEVSKWDNPRVLSFTMTSKKNSQSVNFDVLPAFDVLGQVHKGFRPDPQVYINLIKESWTGGEFSTCFTELQKFFLKQRCTKLKSLIRLVKHWYRRVEMETFPPQYALELLTVYAWEHGSQETDFNTAQGFRTVLYLIEHYQELKVYWTINYDFQDVTIGEYLKSQLKKPRPVILDPADPTGDVGGGSRWRWDKLAEEARRWSSNPCFKNGDGSWVKPWDVPVEQTLEGRKGYPPPSYSIEGFFIHNPVVQPQCSYYHQRNPSAQEESNCTILPTSSQSQVRTLPAVTGVMELYQTPVRALDKFVQDNLMPQKGFLDQVSQAVNIICKVLREKCFQNSISGIRVTKVIKGGSYGRGTALRGGSDVDLIVFLSCFKAYGDQGAWQPDNFTEIQAQLEACWEGLSLQFSAQEDPQALRFRLMSATLHSWMDVSLRPSFDALGPLNPGSKPRPQVYVDLISNGFPAGTYSKCFTELQRDFVNSRPSKLKSLILLVKYWYQQVTSRYKAGAQDKCLPPVYALELLTIYAWEQAGRKDKFHMAEGFLTVLGLIHDYQQLCIYWTVNYDFEDKTIRNWLQKQLQKPRPLILDPADPTWNVGHGSWEKLAQEAETCGGQPCFVNGDRSPVQRWDVMPALLQQTPSWDLDNFISKFLQPNGEFLGQVRRAVDIICSFLKENCFRNSSIKVLKVVKGGSSAKGTALKGRSDADLVVFLSCFRGFEDQGTNRAEIITEIREQLEACRREKDFDVKFEISKWENPRVLSFTLTSKTLDHSVDFDVLPAFDALGQLDSGTKPKPQVYVDLINSYNNGGEFSSCFTELQRDFVISRPTKLKSLIRLVKHWYKQCMRVPKGRGALPPQYALELLTIYAWEQGNGTAQFNMAEGFRTVLELVQNYKNLCIHWKVNYDPENESIKNFLAQQLQKPRPIILDPADPTGNLGHGTRWDLLAKKAASYANSICCANKSGDFVQPWKLKVTS